jgi:hypothetical protein
LIHEKEYNALLHKRSSWIFGFLSNVFGKGCRLGSGRRERLFPNGCNENPNRQVEKEAWNAEADEATGAGAVVRSRS